MQIEILMPTILSVAGSTAMTLAPSMTHSSTSFVKAVGLWSFKSPNETVIGSPDQKIINLKKSEAQN